MAQIGRFDVCNWMIGKLCGMSLELSNAEDGLEEPISVVYSNQEQAKSGISILILKSDG